MERTGSKGKCVALPHNPDLSCPSHPHHPRPGLRCMVYSRPLEMPQGCLLEPAQGPSSTMVTRLDMYKRVVMKPSSPLKGLCFVIGAEWFIFEQHAKQ